MRAVLFLSLLLATSANAQEFTLAAADAYPSSTHTVVRYNLGAAVPIGRSSIGLRYQRVAFTDQPVADHSDTFNYLRLELSTSIALSSRTSLRATVAPGIATDATGSAGDHPIHYQTALQLSKQFSPTLSGSVGAAYRNLYSWKLVPLVAIRAIRRTMEFDVRAPGYAAVWRLGRLHAGAVFRWSTLAFSSTTQIDVAEHRMIGVGPAARIQNRNLRFQFTMLYAFSNAFRTYVDDERTVTDLGTGISLRLRASILP